MERPTRNHGRPATDKKRQAHGDATGQEQASQYARSLIEASLDPLVTISA